MMRALTNRGTIAGSRDGFAVLSVLFVLLAVLALCTPFLMTANNASKSSTQLADQVQGRLALDSAARHARARLGGSHPAVDPTPYFDDEDEIAVTNALPKDFLDPSNAGGVMWDLEVHDVAGQIDLNSASPQVFANMLGLATRLSVEMDKEAKELTVASAGGLAADGGFLWVGRELIGYQKIDGRTVSGLVRGLLHQTDVEGKPLECGAGPAEPHANGTMVIDQRAFGPVLWRLLAGTGELRGFDAVETLRDAGRQTLVQSLGEESLLTLARLGSPYAEVRGGRRWQRAVRLTNTLKGGVDCLLRVDEMRWFNPGATVRIESGEVVEFGIVGSVEAGGVRLMDPVKGSYRAYEAEVRVLARRPVNANLASAEVLETLFLNLQLKGENSRVVQNEARALAGLVIASRPLTGHEDFLRRVLLPAAGLEVLPADASTIPETFAEGGQAHVIDARDAIAVYRNALNSNDVALAFSTMPLSFTSRDVYAMNLRASVNAEAGIERVSLARDQVELVVPQRELMQVFARQEDFDEALRIDCEAPYWSTGPNATSRFDDGAVPPSRIWAHFGTYNGQVYVPGITQLPPGDAAEAAPTAEHVFASRETDGWAQLWASRTDEEGERNGHVMHFDHETRDPEGRYLPDEPITLPLEAELVEWLDPDTDLLKSLSLGLWIKPRELVDGILLDVGGSSTESDRVTLSFEGPDLVLRVRDAAGDHPATALVEAGEVRFELAPGDGPGLAPDTWSHVMLDVRGTRPEQMSMLVDGRDFGVRTPGLTRLTAPFNQGQSLMQVDSTEGFPARGTARIGQELVEFRVSGPTMLDCTRSIVGVEYGFGGRMARETFDLARTDGVEPGINFGVGKQLDHAVGTPVSLYGYSLPLESNVSGAVGAIQGDIGPFAVGYVAAVRMQGSSQWGSGVPVYLRDIAFFQVGSGIEGDTLIDAVQVTSETDNAQHTLELLRAFDPNGGYVAFLQAGIAQFQTTGPNSQSTGTLISLNGFPIFGVEVMRYTGVDYNENALVGLRRAALPGLAPGGGDVDNGPHAFIIDWDAWIGNDTDLDDNLEWKLWVAPISLDVGPGGGGFLVQAGDPAAGDLVYSEFAQITYPGDPSQTEWVRYDTIAEGRFLVRNGPDGLRALTTALGVGGLRGRASGGPPLPPDWPPGPPPPEPPEPPGPPPVELSKAAEPPSAAQNPVGGSDWTHYLGAPDPSEAQKPVTSAARTAFQFRGVFGTYAHPHVQGTTVLPVFHCLRGDVDRGRPGRLDAAFLFDAAPNDPGWPVVVHRAVWPFQYSVTAWDEAQGNTLQPVATGQVAVMVDPYYYERLYIALEEVARVPIAAGTVTGSTVPETENRLQSRIVMHPSGERPRAVTAVSLGGAVQGGEVPSAVIDEVVFGSPLFDASTTQGNALQGASFVIGSDPNQTQEGLTQGATDFYVAPKAIRGVAQLYGENDKEFLSELPPDAGLMRVGSEILCYNAYGPESGSVVVAPSGRALLGTREETHEVGETVTFLEHMTVSVLAGAISADDSMLTLASVEGFPYSGTVLVDTELIHYTRRAGNTLQMPRLSTEPGAKDERGKGLFRGRYGTTPAGHVDGTPVILFPFRYWDRWQDRADAPELAYFGFVIDQPSAYWQTLFWQSEEPSSGGSRVFVLQRTDPNVPWDADPDQSNRLDVLGQGMPEGKGNLIGVQSDRVEWRAFVRFAPGAFDELGGTSHAWKQTPRLRLLGSNFVAPNVVLRRVDR